MSRQFRKWLKEKYHEDLDELNRAWWTSFWSHSYSDWNQIESPAPHGEHTIMGLTLDWNGIDYWKFAPHVDFVSWDNYPYWHGERPDPVEGGRRAFIHDINRSLKHGRPFAMMESSPSSTNWQPVGKLRRPGMHV